jgi:hypothetical protein
MLRLAWKIAPVAAGGVILALAAFVQGWWTDRWLASPQLGEACERLKGVPLVIGDWDGQDIPINPRDLEQAHVHGYLSRRYTNRRDGTEVLAVMLCGRSGPLSLHTPDVCYRGAGFEPLAAPVRQQVRWNGGQAPAELLTAVFQKQEPSRTANLRVYWSWSAAGPWETPEDPRVAYGSRPALYKLYVEHQMAFEGDLGDEDPAIRFLGSFLPELQRSLFPKS